MQKILTKHKILIFGCFVFFLIIGSFAADWLSNMLWIEAYQGGSTAAYYLYIAVPNVLMGCLLAGYSFAGAVRSKRLKMSVSRLILACFGVAFSFLTAYFNSPFYSPETARYFMIIAGYFLVTSFIQVKKWNTNRFGAPIEVQLLFFTGEIIICVVMVFAMWELDFSFQQTGWMWVRYLMDLVPTALMGAVLGSEALYRSVKAKAAFFAWGPFLLAWVPLVLAAILCIPGTWFYNEGAARYLAVCSGFLTTACSFSFGEKRPRESGCVLNA